MDWIVNLFLEHSAIQAVIVIAMICAAGLMLSRVRIFGISLGVTFVFFVGILAGHFGLSVDPMMLLYAEDFGLVLFVYALGLQVGPGFISSFRRGGVRLNSLALSLVLVGTFFAILLAQLFGISVPDVMGILCGATTNTPALAAEQQTLKLLGLNASVPALGCAVTYPLGVVGVILAILLLRKCLVRAGDALSPSTHDDTHTYIAAYRITNPGIFGKDLEQLADLINAKFVISRVWRDGKVTIPTSHTVIYENDRLLAVTSEKDAPLLNAFFGQQEDTDWNGQDIDWNSIDQQLVSQRIVITRPELNGKSVAELRLRNVYGVNISRVYRSGVQLLATANLMLQLGDRVTVVGEEEAVSRVANLMGNAVKDLEEPNLVAIFVGMVLGLIVGSIPIFIPGMSTPLKLGLAGGPIIVGILIGAYGPRVHMVTYTTRSANLMMRSLGLSMYLACLGLDSGAHFFETVVRPEGLLWVGVGFLLTVLPVLVVGACAFKLVKLDFASTCGMLCGAMANPMALTYANETIGGDASSVAYAAVYPLCMFLRVVIAQVVILLLV